MELHLATAKELGQVNRAVACQCPRESSIFDCLFLPQLPLLLMHSKKDPHICSSNISRQRPCVMLQQCFLSYFLDLICWNRFVMLCFLEVIAVSDSYCNLPDQLNYRKKLGLEMQELHMLENFMTLLLFFMAYLNVLKQHNSTSHCLISWQ